MKQKFHENNSKYNRQYTAMLRLQNKPWPLTLLWLFWNHVTSSKLLKSKFHEIFCDMRTLQINIKMIPVGLSLMRYLCPLVGNYSPHTPSLQSDVLQPPYGTDILNLYKRIISHKKCKLMGIRGRKYERCRGLRRCTPQCPVAVWQHVTYFMVSIKLQNVSGHPFVHIQFLGWVNTATC